ncbi:MAG: TlyA family RNA methyltransferase [Clostridia bacterium]|nr:TlyA family RNA methyltransferase [Clostridia bacterium]
MRLDVYLFEKGLAKSRSRASEMISGGYVTVDGKCVTKPSCDVDDSKDVKVTGEEHGFVGRGGIKLDGALTRFGIDVSGMICADIGASTGGFTDCLLGRGASHVYSVDSGHDQLDEKLKADSRVTNIEGCNARYLDDTVIPVKCDCAVCDVSFISQTLIIPAVSGILREGGIYVALIKPQFECGREALGKGGIVKDKKQHIAAIRRVLSSAVQCGLSPQKLMKSTIKGRDGNVEFLFCATLGGMPNVNENHIREVVNE